MWASILFIVAGYLCGSISCAHLLGYAVWKVDLHQYGSRKLSASNLYHQAGVVGLVLAGIGDLGKALLPAWLARRWGLDLTTTVAVGLAAVLGHNWPLFFGLKGGRGIGAILGALVIVYPLGALWILGWVIAGRIMPHAAAVPALIGLATLPLLSAIQTQPNATTLGCFGMLAIAVVKRLEANCEPPPDDERLWHVFWRRLLLDRDIADFETWVERRPDAA